MIALIGKTASGKDSIKKELLKLGYESVVTTTTRPMRPGEVQDVSYHFIDKSQFRRLNIQGFFAETTSYDTVHGTWYYGTQKKDLKDNDNKVIILNPDGILSLMRTIDMSDWVVFFIDCPEEIIKERLNKRGDNPEEAERRLEADRKDFINIERLCDHRITNDGRNKPEEIAYKIKALYERSSK